MPEFKVKALDKLLKTKSAGVVNDLKTDIETQINSLMSSLTNSMENGEQLNTDEINDTFKSVKSKISDLNSIMYYIAKVKKDRKLGVVYLTTIVHSYL